MMIILSVLSLREGTKGCKRTPQSKLHSNDEGPDPRPSESLGYNADAAVTLKDMTR
jgi:hypothetical protein